MEGGYAQRHDRPGCLVVDLSRPDPRDRLERQIDDSNENLKQSDAPLRAARAVVREQQSSFFPSLTVTPQVQRQKNALSATTSYTLKGTETSDRDGCVR